MRDLLRRRRRAARRWRERFELLMVDEFQDTNRLQLDVLEMLERDNLFAVGDEFQSIYGFRHADVTIFRGARGALGAAACAGCGRTSARGEELLDVLDGAFGPCFGDALRAAGRRARRRPAGDDVELRLFDPDHVARRPASRPSSCWSRTRSGWDDVADLGLELPGEQPGAGPRRAWSPQRLREEVDRGRRPGRDRRARARGRVAAADRAGARGAGLATYVVGGRGYWSQEQVRDGLAYLSRAREPARRGGAVRGARVAVRAASAPTRSCSPRAAGRRAAGGAVGARCASAAAPLDGRSPAPSDRGAPERVRALFAAERAQAERLPAEVLLERAVAATGYDLAVLARPGGERRLANLRKLMRLAREFERAEGRDLRGFLAFAATQDLVQAREGEAALEGEGLDAVRLMTIHRAKGLEFPVVCVADLGRARPGGAAAAAARRRRRRVGIRLRALGAPRRRPGARLRGAGRPSAPGREDEEERRLLYVAMTRPARRCSCPAA